MNHKKLKVGEVYIYQDNQEVEYLGKTTDALVLQLHDEKQALGLPNYQCDPPGTMRCKVIRESQPFAFKKLTIGIPSIMLLTEDRVKYNIKEIE